MSFNLRKIEIKSWQEGLLAGIRSCGAATLCISCMKSHPPSPPHPLYTFLDIRNNSISSILNIVSAHRETPHSPFRSIQRNHCKAILFYCSLKVTLKLKYCSYKYCTVPTITSKQGNYENVKRN